MPAQKHSLVLTYLQITFFAAVILYFGKTLFIPMFFGLLVAMVMYPICHWLEEKKWPRSLAITACLLIVTTVIAGLVALLIWQINALREDAPVIIKKFKEQLPGIQQWLSDALGVTATMQNDWAEKLLENGGNILAGTINNVINTLFMFFIIPVFTALFLFHRKVFVQYLQSIAGEKYRHQLDDILQESIYTYFNFIKGMVLVYLIVGILNSIGLLALGIRHAILFGMVCAIMTIIPYIGIFVSALLPISIAWITTDSVWYPLGVIAVFSFVQYLEANVIFPKVVGTQLHVSTWATLVAIIAGGILWGVSGMILFIPFVAILKIVTDNIEEWKPLNLLLGRK
ncbi:MAG: AI-2E family transporter [Chitinophagaceae bacterium]|nr:AI-2E family transporter [Chitinophagaceae bacterium]